MMDVFVSEFTDPSDGVTLADESERAKGDRITRFLDEFCDSDFGVTAITWRGHSVMLVKHDEDRHAHTPDDVEARL